MPIQPIRSALLPFFCLLLLPSCRKHLDPNAPSDYRQAMRDLVTSISAYAKARQPGFAVIPQNGIELVTDNGEHDGTPSTAYLAAIDGNGQEDLFYGYVNDNQASPANETQYLIELLNVSKNAGKTILVTDYCSTPSKMDDSYQKNSAAGYIGFAADHRDLNNIPAYPNPIHLANADSIGSLAAADNFLYLLDTENWGTRTDFIQAVTATNYDLLITDLFFTDNSAFTAAEVEQLRHKANGGRRMVICYCSIGEAEDYRYYWQPDWNQHPPEWLADENPDWAGNYKVWYWNPDWQAILYGNPDSYLQKILDAGFDGVYLDIVDGFEYWE